MSRGTGANGTTWPGPDTAADGCDASLSERAPVGSSPERRAKRRMDEGKS